VKMLAMTVLCIDKYPELGLELPGGNSINIAARWKKLGERDVAVLGAVGDDAMGEKVMAFLKASGIDHERARAVPGVTAHNHFYASNDGHLFRENGWDGGVFATFALSEEDWDYASGFDLIAMPYYSPCYREASRRLGEAKIIVADFLDKAAPEPIIDELPRIDLAFASGTRALADALEERAEETGVPVIITLGAEGSMALVRGERFFQEALPVERKVDSIGCGDSFQAAFVSSWYREGDPRKALRAGAESAADILGRHGGI